MAEFNAVTLAGTDFEKDATIEQVHNSAGGSFYITGGNVYYNLQYPIPQGRGKPIIWTQSEWTPDRLLPTGPGEIPAGVMGIRFKNADGTAPATVTAAIADPGQPVLTVSSPGTVASATASMVTGIIPAAGTAPTAGTGFTYTHTNGTGIYVFLLATPFAAAPIVLVTSGGPRASDFLWSVTAVTAAGFTVNTWTASTAVAADAPFSFLAQAVS